MRRTLLSAAIAAPTALVLPFLTGCAPAVVAGTAVLVNEEITDPETTVIVGQGVEYTWASVKSTMAYMTDDLLDIDDDLRMVKTYVDGAQVTVWVETYTVEETKVRVEAERYMVFSPEVAANVRNSIERDLR